MSISFAQLYSELYSVKSHQHKLAIAITNIVLHFILVNLL